MGATLRNNNNTPPDPNHNPPSHHPHHHTAQQNPKQKGQRMHHLVSGVVSRQRKTYFNVVNTLFPIKSLANGVYPPPLRAVMCQELSRCLDEAERHLRDHQIEEVRIMTLVSEFIEVSLSFIAQSHFLYKYHRFKGIMSHSEAIQKLHASTTDQQSLSYRQTIESLHSLVEDFAQLQLDTTTVCNLYSIISICDVLCTD